MIVKDPPVQITPKLWMLGSSAYPLYLFQGERDGVLFEGGVSAMGPLVRRQLDQLGIRPQTIRQVVITHGHPDHVMAVPMLRTEFPGVAVLASAKAAQTLAVDKVISLFCQIDEALTGALLQVGMIGQEDRVPPFGGPIPVDRLIQEGDTIAVDAAVFEVLQTPGHSDCSLSFYEPTQAILIISDASGYYLPEHHYWWPNYFADYGAYLRSLERLAGLKAEVLCLSHNAVVQGAADVQEYFRGAIAATQQYHQRILDETRAGKTVRQIAEALGSEVYQKTQLLPLDFFQKNCGLLVKLSLRHEGLA